MDAYENIITGLSRCIGLIEENDPNGDCGGCPYNESGACEEARSPAPMMRDALDMLEVQNRVITCLQAAFDKTIDEIMAE